LVQDSLLTTRREFKVGNWIAQARKIGRTEDEKRLYEWNARVQITTWGNRKAADEGGLRDYSHREWSGLLKDFYYPRWKAYFDMLGQRLNGVQVQDIDWYAMEEPWTWLRNDYPAEPEENAVEIAQWAYGKVFVKIR